MHIQINGKHIDVGDALRTYVEDRLEGLVGKYFDNAVDGSVTFSREGHRLRCDAQVHLPTGIHAQATAVADEIYAAFDGCVERIDKQLRRYKRRLKDYQPKKGEVEAAPASAYVIRGEHDEEPDTLDPVIVAEMTMDIRTISVGEAVMRMELAHVPFLLFRNERHGGVNVVFRRDDGNIGWVDPEVLGRSA